MKKSFIITTALMITMATVTPSFASTKDDGKKMGEESIQLAGENSSVSQVQTDKYDDYVKLNEDNHYVINIDGIKELNEEEKQELASILSNANKNIDFVISNSIDEEALEIEIISPTNEEESIMLMAASYKEGVSKVTFHWWGMKIYLSKTLANKGLYAGVTLAGIWMPSKVLASAGVALGLTSTGLYKGGIWIEQYWVASVGPVKTLFGFNSVGYQ